ncbi:MAG: hypothetical protein LBS61_00585 [Endomicrobium sp.]|jgi:uncharacterized phage-associated protein|nr:hypothetical protein [Endomicrobium sp.]
MKKNIPVIDNVKELAAYIRKRYQEQMQREISPLKLQKSLYFLFAYWGGFIRKGKQSQSKRNSIEVDYNEFSEYLYKANIEAWVYGPVLPDVYRDSDIDRHYRANVLSEGFVTEFVTDLLGQLFKVSDFRLVDIAHADKVWKKYFNPNTTTHNNEMPLEEIIDEYSTKI